MTQAVDASGSPRRRLLPAQMRRRATLPALAALALLGSLVVGPAAPAQPERLLAGTVVIIHEQEPPSLRGGWIDNNLGATGLVTNNIWYGRSDLRQQGGVAAAALRGQAQLVKTSPQTVTFKYKASAVWSDGKPVTCEDWKATWRVFVNPQFNVVSREGWKDIKSVTCKGKSGTIVFARPFAAVGAADLRGRLRRSRHPGPEHESDVQRLHSRLERAVEASRAGSAAFSSRWSEPQVQGRPAHEGLRLRAERGPPPPRAVRRTAPGRRTDTPKRRPRQPLRRRQPSRADQEGAGRSA